MMGTRTGDIDPAVVQYLVNRYGMEWNEIFNIMNKNSGLLGISGVSKDVRVIEGYAKKGNERCKLALKMFCYRIAKYIGAYSVTLGKVDAIVFTGGIGENSNNIRKEICSYLGILGVKIDNRKNSNKKNDITAQGSKIKVFVIPTNEERIIAEESVAVLKGV